MGDGVDLDELGTLDVAGAEDGNVGQRAFDHGDFVAGVEARTGLAVFVDFVGQGVAVGYAEAVVLEVAGDAREEADGHHLVLFGFFDEGFEDFVAGTEAAILGLDNDGADFGEVWAVEMERAAAEEVRCAFGRGAGGDGEVADVFADFGVVAAKERAVAGERVDELVDVLRVLNAGFVDADVWVASHARLPSRT